MSYENVLWTVAAPQYVFQIKESFQHDQPVQFAELLYRWMMLKQYHLVYVYRYDIYIYMIFIYICTL